MAPQVAVRHELGEATQGVLVRAVAQRGGVEEGAHVLHDGGDVGREIGGSQQRLHVGAELNQKPDTCWLIVLSSPYDGRPIV